MLRIVSNVGFFLLNVAIIASSVGCLFEQLMNSVVRKHGKTSTISLTLLGVVLIFSVPTSIGNRGILARSRTDHALYPNRDIRLLPKESKLPKTFLDLQVEDPRGDRPVRLD